MKILAVASAGGHWIQLLRLMPAFKDKETVYMSTKEGFDVFVNGAQYIHVPDANRKNKLQLLRSFLFIYRTIRRIKPNVVVTTGAAPGLMAILAGRIGGAKTIWIDSIANVEELSMSGRIATKIASKVYTQWPNLVEKKVFYSGNVLS